MKNKKIKILIPNATSPRNIGDLAMLDVLLDLIKKAHKNSEIIIHSTEHKSHNRKIADRISHTLYSWAVFSKTDAFTRINRISQLVLVYFLVALKLPYGFISKELRELVEDYKNSKLIIFVGGGYLRSKKGITQTLNLLMILFIFQFSRLFKVNKIVAPISFGPFAYKWQEELSAKVLNGLGVLSAREDISHQLMKKNKLGNVALSADHALLLKSKKSKSGNRNKFILGFTIRNWLDKSNQSLFERHFVNALLRFSEETGSFIQPIVQVDAPKYGDKDLVITTRISRYLKKHGIRVLKVKRNNSLNKSLVNYSNIDALLGMRMHSNILAATQNKPFIAIAYEHKTNGISKQLGMDKYCIKVEDVNEDKLYRLLINMYKKYDKNSSIIKNKLDVIRRKELRFWTSTL